MTTIAPSAPRFSFKKNLPLLNQGGSLGFELSASKADLMLVLTSDTARFPDGDVELADIKATASTPKPIEFARGTDKVSFTAQGSAFAGFGIYRSGAALLARLGDGARDLSLETLEFGVDEQSLLSVLRWGYGANARTSGAIALGAIGGATIGVAGDAEGLFAVVRRLPSDRPAREIVQATADSWLLPRQITSIDQVEPGTWIVAEVAGGISIALGAQLGYDFNWVREASLGNLSGDIGLRLQMGINAAVGFSASGRCAVVVSRESEAKSLRVRLFRVKTREMDLSFNATVGIQAKDTLLPDTIDDFIAAVFDTHGAQILSDLKVLEKWTDPNRSLASLLADAGIDGAESLIAALTGTTPERLQQEFDAVQSRAVSFVTKWHQLPHPVSAALLKLVEEKVDLSTVRDVASRLATITFTELEALLDTHVQRIDFFHTPVGRYLESITENGVLGVLNMPLDRVRDVGSRTAAVLDGGVVEDTLGAFQRFVETRLHLDAALSAANETDFAALDSLLKKKLANFLGEKTLALKDLENVRRAVGLLLERRKEYYDKALEALHRKYSVALTAASQSTTTDRALFDASFDFSRDPSSVTGFLQSALQGRLDDLLTIQPAQVTIAAAQLSHGVSRQTHIDVTLPFMDVRQSHLNDSLASIEAVPHEGGLLMKLKASDTSTTSNQRKSSLSLAMGMSRRKKSAIRFHQDSLELSYSLLFAKRNMQTKHVRAQVGPAIETFFAGRIESVDAFTDLLDQQTEAAIPNGPNLLGNGLIALDVALTNDTAAAIGQAWLALPEARTARAYADMSVAIQQSLKASIFDCVFGTPDGYTQTGLSRTQLFVAYCALVPRAESAPRWFWDWPQPGERRVMLHKPQTVLKMRELLAAAQRVLQEDPDTARHFRAEDAVDILARVDERDEFLNSLLAAENDIIQHALDGGASIAASQNASPSEAIKALARFGSRLTEAFHGDITSLLGAGLQSIGARVFLDASRAIAGPLAARIKAEHAMLSVEFLKSTAAFDAAALLEAGHVAADQLAVADRVVAIAP